MLDLQNYTWATANWNAPPSHCKSSRQIICRLKFMKQIPEPNWHFIFYVFYRLLTSKRNSVSVRGVARPYGLPLSACNSAVTKCRSAVSCSSLRWRKSPSGPSGLHVFFFEVRKEALTVTACILRPDPITTSRWSTIRKLFSHIHTSRWSSD